VAGRNPRRYSRHFLGLGGRPGKGPSLPEAQLGVVCAGKPERGALALPMKPDIALTRMRCHLVLHLASRLRDDMLRGSPDETPTALPSVEPFQSSSHDAREETPTAPFENEAVSSAAPSTAPSMPDDWLISAALGS
jgi:hypothetical protein